jgi:hypothetical protein
MMNANSPHELQDALEQLNAAAQLIRVGNEKAAQRIETSTHALGQSAQHLTGSSERQAQEMLDTLRTQGAQALSQGAE